MDFSQALAFLKVGKKMARRGWHGKDLFIALTTNSKSNDWEEVK